MCIKENLSNAVVLMSEPLKGKTPDEVRAYFADKSEEIYLAEALALTHEKFVWLEDEVYDYEEGTEEHMKARKVAREWLDLMQEYETRIYEVLISEGSCKPGDHGIKVQEIFMNRNGYVNASGWWIKRKTK